MTNLTAREIKILQLVMEGFDNNEISQKLFISRHTVKAHLSSLIKKLKAKNRTNAVYIALKNKLI